MAGRRVLSPPTWVRFLHRLPSSWRQFAGEQRLLIRASSPDRHRGPLPIQPFIGQCRPGPCGDRARDCGPRQACAIDAIGAIRRVSQRWCLGLQNQRLRVRLATPVPISRCSRCKATGRHDSVAGRYPRRVRLSRCKLRQSKAIEPMAGATGLEPATSGVTGRRSNQLSYAPGMTAISAPSGCREIRPEAPESQGGAGF